MRCGTDPCARYCDLCRFAGRDASTHRAVVLPTNQRNFLNALSRVSVRSFVSRVKGVHDDVVGVWNSLVEAYAGPSVRRAACSIVHPRLTSVRCVAIPGSARRHARQSCHSVRATHTSSRDNVPLRDDLTRCALGGCFPSRCRYRAGCALQPATRQRSAVTVARVAQALAWSRDERLNCRVGTAGCIGRVLSCTQVTVPVPGSNASPGQTDAEQVVRLTIETGSSGLVYEAGYVLGGVYMCGAIT